MWLTCHALMATPVQSGHIYTAGYKAYGHRWHFTPFQIISNECNVGKKNRTAEFLVTVS